MEREIETDGKGGRRKIECEGTRTTPLFVHHCDDDDDDQTRSSFSSVNIHSFLFTRFIRFSSEAYACVRGVCERTRVHMNCICISLTLCVFLILFSFLVFRFRVAECNHSSLLCNALRCMLHAAGSVGRMVALEWNGIAERICLHLLSQLLPLPWTLAHSSQR